MTSRGASRVGEVRGTGYVEVRAKGAAPDLLRRLRNDPAVAEVSLDYQRRTAALPNDPYFAGSQSYLDTVRLQQAWDLSKGSTSQIIAVVDTGVDGLHADLQGVTVDGYNAITGRPSRPARTRTTTVTARWWPVSPRPTPATASASPARPGPHG